MGCLNCPPEKDCMKWNGCSCKCHKKLQPLTDDQIKKIISDLPLEVKVAMEKELLGSSKIAINILKALKERGWSVGEWEDAQFPEDRGFEAAPDTEVTKVIDIELEKGGLI